MKIVEVSSGWYRVFAICDPRGDCQLRDFLASLAKTMGPEARKMMALLRRAALEGPLGNSEKSNSLGDGIFEFKTKSLRILYFFDEDRVIVCSHGFIKKTQRCPPRQITEATKNRTRYFAAKAFGELERLDE